METERKCHEKKKRRYLANLCRTLTQQSNCRTDSRNKITIYDPKADGTYLGQISDCGWPSASRNA
jgi:hypothetical protein